MNEYLTQLFLDDIPFLDVRAESEFASGAFPLSTNIPILNDDERHQIGICHKESGQDAAEALGRQLVSGDTRANRVNEWVKYVESNANAHLYCWRGGKRSGIAGDWLREAGYEIPRIEGGYKSLRNALLERFLHLPRFLLLSGNTGVGKTDLIRSVENSIDLEGCANHRGSAFGKRVMPQPSQVDFENAVAIDLLKTRPAPFIVLEDESRLIGRIQIPHELKNAMDASPVVILREPKEQRVERIRRDYILSQYDDLYDLHGESAIDYLSDQLLSATDAIRKRLGGVKHEKVKKLMKKALSQHAAGKLDAHREWIDFLLNEYYDPMYDYQIDKKRERVLFSGSRAEIMDWLAEKAADSEF